MDTAPDQADGHTSGANPVFTSTSATVYFKCSRSGSGSTCDPYRHNYSRPSVTITLSGLGNVSGVNAELSFGSNVHIYNGTTKTTGYAWTANGACTRNIGYYASKTAQSDQKTHAGTLEADTLVLSFDGISFNVSVPKIVINNPY